LQKVLARAGVASRRNSEVLILEGAVTVNGLVVTALGTKVDAKKDKIKVHGKLIFAEVEPIYLALYKPRGVISAMSDPEGRPHLELWCMRCAKRSIPSADWISIRRPDSDDQRWRARRQDSQRPADPKDLHGQSEGPSPAGRSGFFEAGFFYRIGVVRFASFGVEQTLANRAGSNLKSSRQPP